MDSSSIWLLCMLLTKTGDTYSEANPKRIGEALTLVNVTKTTRLWETEYEEKNQNK